MSEEEEEMNPDRVCTGCGETDWNKFLEEKPHGDNSDVKKHLFECTNCSKHGYLYQEGGNQQFSGALR